MSLDRRELMKRLLAVGAVGGVAKKGSGEAPLPQEHEGGDIPKETDSAPPSEPGTLGHLIAEFEFQSIGDVRCEPRPVGDGLWRTRPPGSVGINGQPVRYYGSDLRQNVGIMPLRTHSGDAFDVRGGIRDVELCLQTIDVKSMDYIRQFFLSGERVKVEYWQDDYVWFLSEMVVLRCDLSSGI